MTALNKTFCLLQNNIGNLNVSLCRLVKGRGNNLCLNTALHICNLLRSLVYKENYHIHLRMVIRDCISYLLKEHCLTCLRLCHYKSSLALSNRGKHIHNPARYIIVSFIRKVKLLIREERRKEIKWNPIPNKLRTSSINHIYLGKREILVALSWRTNLTHNGISSLKSKELNLRLRDIYIIGRIKVVIIRRT